MKFFFWRRLDPIDALIQPPRQIFTTHDQSKGAIAFAKSKAEALAIRREHRVDSREVLRRVK